MENYKIDGTLFIQHQIPPWRDKQHLNASSNKVDKLTQTHRFEAELR
jgi:hypothetical protein